jgi:hypothetical protein
MPPVGCFASSGDGPRLKRRRFSVSERLNESSLAFSLVDE